MVIHQQHAPVALAAMGRGAAHVQGAVAAPLNGSLGARLGQQMLARLLGAGIGVKARARARVGVEQARLACSEASLGQTMHSSGSAGSVSSPEEPREGWGERAALEGK